MNQLGLIVLYLNGNENQRNITYLHDDVLGIYPLCIKSYELMFICYARLADMESKNETKFKLLKSAFAEDKKLCLKKYMLGTTLTST